MSSKDCVKLAAGRALRFCKVLDSWRFFCYNNIVERQGESSDLNETLQEINLTTCEKTAIIILQKARTSLKNQKGNFYEDE